MDERDSGDLNGLRNKLEQAGLPTLSPEQLRQFNQYLQLLLKWNARTNLTSVRNPEDIVSRHFIECIACAQMLPIGSGSLLDLGSGAGFPGIPIAICRPTLGVTLAESQNKKAAFLNEAVRALGINAQVFSGRAESLKSLFDCVALRAVDRMFGQIPIATALLRPQGFLVLMITRDQEDEIRRFDHIAWQRAGNLPGSLQRLVLVGSLK